MEEFGKAVLDVNSGDVEPCGLPRETKTGKFVRKFIVRYTGGATLVTVLSNKLETLNSDEIPIQFKSDFVFAVD